MFWNGNYNIKSKRNIFFIGREFILFFVYSNYVLREIYFLVFCLLFAVFFKIRYNYINFTIELGKGMGIENNFFRVFRREWFLEEFFKEGCL